MTGDGLDELVRLAGTGPENLLRDLIARSAVPMGVVDPLTGGFVVVNDAFSAWLDYTTAELTGMPWSALNHPADVASTNDWIARVMSGEISSYRMTKRYQRKGGAEVWGDLSIAALRRADATVWALVGQVVDITEQVRVNRALRESESRFRLLAEHSGDVVWRASPQRIIEYVSPSVTRTLGWTAEQLIGTTPADLVHPDDVAELPHARVAREGSATFRARFACADGSYKWCEVHLVSVHDEQGAGGYVSTMRDAERQVRAEEALSRSEQQYRLIAENASDVVFRGTPQAVVEWVSPSVRQELGLSPEDIVGKHVSDILHPADLPLMLASSDAVNRGERITYRARVRTADGSWRWVEVTAKPVTDNSGAVVARVGSMRNVDARVQTERALEVAKEQAVSASLAKTAFLSRMSHELRTPLNAVLGFAQLLALDELSAEQREAVEQIRVGGRHLLDLINEVLDISRIEAGRLTVSLESVNVADVLSESTELVRVLACEADVAISVMAAPGLHVWADRQRTIQILVNLLSNAIKYNHAGGTVSVACVAGNATVQIHVADTGIGIAADQMPALFEPFERLGAEKTGIEGIGVGLALSQGLARAMSGHIEVTSGTGQGSTFTLVLPDAPAAADLVASPIAVAVGGGRLMRVLYVEDNPANVRLMRRVSELRELTLLTVATTGEQALVAATRNPPDLILLDLHLPDISGIDVLTALRADDRTRAVPVVMVSADAGRAARRVCLELGAAGFLTKPLDISEILHTINHPPLP